MFSKKLLIKLPKLFSPITPPPPPENISKAIRKKKMISLCFQMFFPFTFLQIPMQALNSNNFNYEFLKNYKKLIFRKYILRRI